MSMGARIAIGVVALICGFSFFITALDTSSLLAKPADFYKIAMLCVVIAIACFFPKSHPFTLRIIAYSEFFTSHSSFIHPSKINSANISSKSLRSKRSTNKSGGNK